MLKKCISNADYHLPNSDGYTSIDLAIIYDKDTLLKHMPKDFLNDEDLEQGKHITHCRKISLM